MIRHEDRERELAEIRRLANTVSSQIQIEAPWAVAPGRVWTLPIELEDPDDGERMWSSLVEDIDTTGITATVEFAPDHRTARWVVALVAAALGLALGLLLAVVLLPDQPDRILVPVPEPSPSMRIDPEQGVQA